MTRSYLDYASTAPLRPEAADAMADWMAVERSGSAGDPSRSHLEGLNARTALESAREDIAGALGVRQRQVVFCSGATEGIASACFAARELQPDRQHFVLSAVEHSAVMRWAARGPATVVGASETGRIDISEFEAAMRPETVLAHMQWANHEVATKQPIDSAVEICRSEGVLLHVDAAQAITEVSEAVNSGADVVTISGHKLGGPALGLMILRKGVRLAPLLVGGDQERARRGGLENTMGAVGLAAALVATVQSRETEAKRLRALSESIMDWASGHPGVAVVGDAKHRVPHLVCLELRGVEPQPVLIGLDSLGVAAHSGSSCSSEIAEPSPVLQAMGADAEHSLRLSVGWASVESDVESALSALERILDELNALRPQ